jgi:hypothetical protein
VAPKKTSAGADAPMVRRSYELSPEEERALRWRAQARVRSGGEPDQRGVTEDEAADLEFRALVAATLAGVVVNHREHLGREVGPAFHAASPAAQAEVRRILGI